MIYGVLGGTFDPPHNSHLQIVTNVLKTPYVDKVLVIPCLAHAFDKKPQPFIHRIAMCRLMFKNIKNTEVSDIETTMKHPGRTLELVTILTQKLKDDSFRLIAGADIYLERHKWYKFDKIKTLAPPLYFKRQGITIDDNAFNDSCLDAPPHISSNEIREKLKKKESVTGLVNRDVLEYIFNNRLYGANRWEEKFL